MTQDSSNDQAQRTGSFLREMQTWVDANPDINAALTSSSFTQEVRREATRIEAQTAHFKVDQPSSDIVAQMALIAATHDVLTRAGVTSEAAVEAMVEALARWVRENAQAYSLARLGISRDEPGMAFERARENFKSRGEQRFGSHFVYEQEVSDNNRSYVNITRCLFNEIGRFIGRPEVIKVFCAMDTIWAEEATSAPKNLEFARPTTLAAGDDKCRFQFMRRTSA